MFIQELVLHGIVSTAYTPTIFKKNNNWIYMIGLLYQGQWPISPSEISSTKERSKRIRPTLYRWVFVGRWD